METIPPIVVELEEFLHRNHFECLTRELNDGYARPTVIIYGDGTLLIRVSRELGEWLLELAPAFKDVAEWYGGNFIAEMILAVDAAKLTFAEEIAFVRDHLGEIERHFAADRWRTTKQRLDAVIEAYSRRPRRMNSGPSGVGASEANSCAEAGGDCAGGEEATREVSVPTLAYQDPEEREMEDTPPSKVFGWFLLVFFVAVLIVGLKAGGIL